MSADGYRGASVAGGERVLVRASRETDSGIAGVVVVTARAVVAAEHAGTAAPGTRRDEDLIGHMRRQIERGTA